MNGLRYWGIIPAAGLGKRMLADRPKQYLALDGRMVIDHTIERLFSHPLISTICIALGKEDSYWSDSLFSKNPNIIRADGGEERCHSVLNALEMLADKAKDNDWVLIHDAARPCLRTEDIQLLIEATNASPSGCLLASRVRDTMKRSSTLGQVTETVEREDLWHAYTPQIFRYKPLKEALTAALEAGFLVTDEASAIEWRGEAPLLVEGHSDNIKITRPEDLALAAYYLQQQAES